MKDLFKPAPAHFAPAEAWPEYGHVAIPRTICAREEVGKNPKGVRWSLWPITFEEYVSDHEPVLSDATGTLDRFRLVAWRRISRTDVPEKWHTLSRLPFRIDGYHELQPGFVARWHKKARHDLRLWHEHYLHKEYKIEEIAFEEFLQAYKQSTVAKKLGLDLLEVLARKLSLPTAHHITLWGARNIRTGKIIAGTAAIHSPTFQSSIRECPFILPEAKHCYAMTGLMEHWFEDSLKKGVTLLHFTYFRQKGDPRDWGGFTTFKRHFVTGLVAHPPALWRFVGGKFF